MLPQAAWFMSLVYRAGVFLFSQVFLFAIIFSLIIKNPGGEEEETTDEEEEPRTLKDDEEYLHEEEEDGTYS